MRTTKEPGTIIIPLDQCPHYAPICAHWAHLQWYLERDIAFDVNILAYRRKASNDLLPRVFVACIDSLPVGMASLKQKAIWNLPEMGPWLSSLYVIPDYRKSGIGEQLIKCVTDEAAERGFGELFLFLDHKERLTLIPFYEKRGWLYHSDEIDNDGNLTNIYKFSTLR